MSKSSRDTVSYDGASFFVRGERVLLLAGSVHYPRVHPSKWDALFKTFRDARLNTLETYVFWSEHHPPGSAIELDSTSDVVYDFSGRRDLFGFLGAARDAGLHAILRIGPYVCAEVSYGGFPFALRDVPEMRFRTLNKPFQSAVESWLRYIAKELHARKLLAPAGGPVLLVQLENEYQMVAGAYGNEGAKYLQWCADLQHELDFGVPTIMCYGAADGAVETINAFYAHKELPELRCKHTSQPAMWTECWTGWYDVWGAPHHRRPTEDLAYAASRYFAEGGGGICYYMWMGGTNFGRSPMYLQATSYDYDAPIDEFYMPTAKSKHLSRLHEIIAEKYAPALYRLGKEAADKGKPFCPPKALKLAESVVCFAWSPDLCFVCNDTDFSGPPEVSVPGSAMVLARLPARSVRIVDPQLEIILFDSSAIDSSGGAFRTLKTVEGCTSGEWFGREEHVPDLKTVTEVLSSRRSAQSDLPPEQLSLTKDTTDYCFYSANFEWTSDDSRKEATDGVLLCMEACDYVYVYVNGEFAGRSREPCWEDRKINRWNSYPEAPGFNQKIDVCGKKIAQDASFTITLIVCSLGLVKGDWQLGSGASANMLEEKKGLVSALHVMPKLKKQGDAVIEPIASRKSPWTAVAGLQGEAEGWASRSFSTDDLASPLTAYSVGARKESPFWFDCVFTLPEKKENLVMDLGGMGKGLLWANGQLLGRYWDVEGTRPRNGFLDEAPIVQDATGGPTQRYYYIPPWVLQQDGDKVNLRVTLFEERPGKDPVSAQASLQCWEYS